jgi:PD-(D/E)XK nuclease superfamily
VRLEYDGIDFGTGSRIDLLVGECVVVEVKSLVRLDPAFARQLLTYIRLLKLPVGLLINFGASTLKEGLHCFGNDRAPSHTRSIVLASQVLEDQEQPTALEGDAEARRRREQR